MRESNVFLYRFRLAQFLNKLKARTAEGRLIKKFPVHELSIRQIGILFDASKLDDKNEVIQFANAFQKLNIKVNLLGYIDHKGDTSGLPFRRFTDKECSFFFIPKNSDIDTFLDFKFDIVINADLSQSLSLHYLAAVSHAPFKVGPHSDLDEYYHLILDTKDTFTIKQYISELISILNKVCFNGRLTN